MLTTTSCINMLVQRPLASSPGHLCWGVELCLRLRLNGTRTAHLVNVLIELATLDVHCLRQYARGSLHMLSQL